MKKIIFLALILTSFSAVAQYQGKPMSGSYIQPLQLRHTRDVGVDPMYYLVADTVTGRPYWQLGRKITKLGSTTNQTLSRPLTGTLRLTKNSAASDFVTLPDSSQTNEGSLSVGAGTGITSIINSNTSGSTGVTIQVSSGLSIGESGNTITLTNTSTGDGTLKHIKTNSANNRLGIETSVNAAKDTATVGFAYSTLSPYDYVDTLDNIPFYRNSTTTNSMMQREDIVYDCFIDAFESGDRTLALAANTDSIIRFNSLGNSHLWSYSTTTGIAQYLGSKDKILKVDASVTIRGETSNTFTYTWILERERSGVWTTFLTDYSQMQTTHLHARCNLSRLIDFAPGDRLRVRLRTTSNITVTIRSGYLNVWSISSNLFPF